MKRQLSTALLCLALSISCSVPVRASGAKTLRDAEAVYREQLRLADLGYLNTSVPGVPSEAARVALAAFAAECGGQTLYDAETACASVAEPAAMLRVAAGAQAVAVVRPWDEMQNILTVGATYLMTDRTSGALIRVKYLGGEGHAELAPLSEWDEASLSALFLERATLDKRPVSLAVGSTRYLASLLGDPHTSAPASAAGVQARYCLFFPGSRTHLAPLKDAEHASILS